MAKMKRLIPGDKIYFQGNPNYHKGIYLGFHDTTDGKRYAEVRVGTDHIIDVESADINVNSRPRKVSTDPFDFDDCVNLGRIMLMTDAECVEFDEIFKDVK